MSLKSLTSKSLDTRSSYLTEGPLPGRQEDGLFSSPDPVLRTLPVDTSRPRSSPVDHRPHRWLVGDRSLPRPRRSLRNSGPLNREPESTSVDKERVRDSFVTSGPHCPIPSRYSSSLDINLPVVVLRSLAMRHGLSPPALDPGVNDGHWNVDGVEENLKTEEIDPVLLGLVETVRPLLYPTTHNTPSSLTPYPSFNWESQIPYWKRVRHP